MVKRGEPYVNRLRMFELSTKASIDPLTWVRTPLSEHGLIFKPSLSAGLVTGRGVACMDCEAHEQQSVLSKQGVSLRG